jgi:hypothetical protein
MAHPIFIFEAAQPKVQALPKKRRDGVAGFFEDPVRMLM